MYLLLQLEGYAVFIERFNILITVQKWYGKSRWILHFADVLYNFITENLYKKLLDSIDAISNCVSCNYDFVIHLF